jgi:hypothetical protein
LKWFVVGGIAGVVVAFFFLYALSHEFVAANYAIIFWPTSMVMLGADEGFLFKTITIASAFAGNFLLYGLVAVMIGAVARRVKGRSHEATAE